MSWYTNNIPWKHGWISWAMLLVLWASGCGGEIGSIDRLAEPSETPQKAKPIAISLGNDLQPESQAYASIIDGTIALSEGDFRNAVRFLNDANTQLDTWIGHFDLGRAYLAAGAFAQADSEFERCINRRGEALARISLGFEGESKGTATMLDSTDRLQALALAHARMAKRRKSPDQGARARHIVPL